MRLNVDISVLTKFAWGGVESTLQTKKSFYIKELFSDMKKKTLTALALGAATVATGMASNVHADNVTVTKQQVGDETKITTTTTKEADQQKVAQDKQAISSQQKVVDSAKSSLDSAKANASSTSQAVSSAQSKVDDTKKALDNAKDQVSKVSNSEIKSQVAQDQSQVAQDKSSIQSTQSSIQQDQAKVDQDKQAVANAGQKAQQDQQKLNDDQGKLSDAQNTLNNDQGKLNDVNKQIEQADVPAAVQIPDFLYEQFKDGDNAPLLNADQGTEQTNLYMQAINEFKPTDADNYHVDPRNLTNDQKMELSKFAAQVINEYKQEYGRYDPSNKLLNTPMNASQIAIDVAQGQADYMSQNGYTNYMDNDNSAVDNDYGTIIANYDKDKYDYSHTTTSSLSSLSGESGFNNVFPDNCTMNELKCQLYGTIIRDVIMDDDHGFAHGRDLLYSTYDGIASTNMNDPFMTITTVANYNDQTNNSDPYLQPEAAPDVAALRNQASQLQNTVNADKQAVSDLTNQVNADKAQLEADTPADLEKQLQDDQAKLANDQDALSKAQQQLAMDQEKLTQDQNKLNSIIPAEVAKVQQQLEEAQNNYNNAVKALNDAQSKANASNDEVAKAQQNYLDALNKLNELKQVLENDEKETTTTSVQWVKNEHPVTTASMGNKVVLSSSKNTSEAPQKASTSATTSANKVANSLSNKAVSSVSNSKSSKEQSAHLTTTVTPAKSSSVEENNTVHADTVKAVKAAQSSKVEAENTIHFTSEAPQSSVKKEANKNVLPQMGDENSKATLWGEISLAMAGVLATLGLAGKKRRN